MFEGLGILILGEREGAGRGVGGGRKKQFLSESSGRAVHAGDVDAKTYGSGCLFEGLGILILGEGWGWVVAGAAEVTDAKHGH